MASHAIIVGAGKGTRIGAEINKILLCLDDKPVLFHSIKPFQECDKVASIILVCNKNDIGIISEIKEKFSLNKVIRIVEGGKERQDSVYNGIKYLNANPDDIIIVHNAANPFTDKKLIEEIINETQKHGAAVCGFPSENTIKEADDELFVSKTIDRKKLFQIQTPQAAKFRIIKEAYQKAYSENFYSTDDSALIERAGYKVRIVECRKENFKITTRLDLENARMLINAARVGIGQDSHKFSLENKKLVLGGVHFPDEKGMEANSDGDVILHAVTNALSNAIGGNSLGFYADELCRNGITDSKEYIKPILAEIRQKGFRISSIGISVEGKYPKFRNYEDKIKKSVGEILGISNDVVGFNATSGEELTAFGKGLGLMCYAVAVLEKESR